MVGVTVPRSSHDTCPSHDIPASPVTPGTAVTPATQSIAVTPGITVAPGIAVTPTNPATSGLTVSSVNPPSSINPVTPATPARLDAWLRRAQPAAPVLVMDTEVVAARYEALARALPGVELCYAVKANPLPGVLDTLAPLGASFDIASEAELRLCLEQGVAPSRLSFGSPVKSAVAVARAYEAGVRLFTVDARAELDKVAVHAPGASVLVRLATSGRGAEWPLSRKFGCDPVTALDLLRRARALGLHPGGLTFHVGSQQTDPSQWDAPIATCATLFATAHREGIHLPYLNVGGGFPAPYCTPVPAIEAVGEAIVGSVRRHFGQAPPRLMAEPGRYLVAEAGAIEAQVVLVADRALGEPRRWVYIDCGKFGGLAETADEAIRYPLHVPGRHGDPVRVALAGPTCDSADILYERTPCLLPGDIREGDRLRILCAGAYTYTYASVGFNGFPPLTAVAI